MRLTCPQGHEWDAILDEAGQASPCPVCGAEHATLPPSSSGPPRVVAADLPAVVVGYDILGELGRGGMGVVYQARQPRLDRTVALKLLTPEFHKEPAFAERFAREARALARLNHSHIVTIYDFGLADGQSYIVMEYVDGPSLRQRLRAGPLPMAETLRIALQVCEALQFAHEENIIHRDIKPENILLDRRGRVKIADFGLAKLLGRHTQLALTVSRQMMGTMNYMAPEQFENAVGVDHRADIYSLGVVLYEMLTGGLPLGRFPLPSQKAALDPRLDEIILRALDKDPARRYQQVAEMKAALESIHSARPAPNEEVPTTSLVAAPVSGLEIPPLSWWLMRSNVGIMLSCAIGVVSTLFPWLRVERRGLHQIGLFFIKKATSPEEGMDPKVACPHFMYQPL